MAEVIDRPLRWSRPRGDRKIEGVITHAMGEGVVLPDHRVLPAWDFLNQSPELTGVALSAHCLIAPDGTVIRCVRDDHRANHAGHSRLGTLEDLNWTFLGVEWLLPGEWAYPAFKQEMLRGDVGYTDAQYASAAKLYADWMQRYDFPRARIVGHSQVSGDDVRGHGKGKLDPGVGFNHGKLTIAIGRFQDGSD